MLSELHREEKGQSLILIALALGAMLALMALVLDGGNAYAQRRRMQNAADAGALAGARELALGGTDSEIYALIQGYACDRNGASSFEATYIPDGQPVGSGSVPPGATGVMVMTTNTFPTFFASVIGVTDLTASAEATASYSAAKSVTGLVPIAIEDFDFEPGREYEIWDDEKVESDLDSGIIADGQRGWLNFDGGDIGANELIGWMENGYNDEVEEPVWINGSPGTKASVVQKAKERVGDVVIVAIYDSVREGQNGNGKLDYHVISFGAFRITEVDTRGSPKKIKGVFEKYVVVGDWGGSKDHGGRVVKLTR